MDDKDVYVKFRGEQETWETTFHLTEQDALRIRNLAQVRQSGNPITVQSVDGSAQFKEGNLTIIYQDGRSKNTITMPFHEAKNRIDQAVESARNDRQSEAARQRVWEFVNDLYDGVRVLTLTAGEQINATLLHKENEYIAIRCDDGSVAITDVANKDDIPLTGATAVLMLDKDKNILILSSS